MHEEDSSSANADSPVYIEKTEWTSAGVLKVYLAEGPSFFLRSVYAGDLSPDALKAGSVLQDTEAEILVHAGRVFQAERTAMAYLARAEHSRRDLSLKLQKKEFTGCEIAPALDFLQGEDALNDSRFASAWLRNRLIHHSEGRQKLLAGLLSHGISVPVASRALDDFFLDETGSESDLCARAAEKLIRTGKSPEKLQAALIRRGFPGKMIRSYLEGKKNRKNPENG